VAGGRPAGDSVWVSVIMGTPQETVAFWTAASNTTASRTA